MYIMSSNAAGSARQREGPEHPNAERTALTETGADKNRRPAVDPSKRTLTHASNSARTPIPVRQRERPVQDDKSDAPRARYSARYSIGNVGYY